MRRMTTGGVALLALAIAMMLAAGCGSSDSESGGTSADQTSGGTVGKGSPAKKGGELTVGLAEDPDQLDPTLARTFVGRIVFANMCEKLYDLDADLKIVPQLASALPGALRRRQDRHDQAPRRHQVQRRHDVRRRRGQDVARPPPHARGVGPRVASSRRSASVKVVDPSTVAIKLSTPFAPLTAQLADRAGMVMSPKQLKKLGEKFATSPVCVGPFKYASRSEGDSIVLERAPDYYDAAKVKLDELTFKIIAESSARASNLRSGDVDVIDRLEPTDLPTIKKDSKLQTLAVTSLGYQGLTVNVGQQERARQAAREGQHAARVAAEAARGVRRRHRPQGHRQDRLRRRRRAGVQPDLAGQPAARREPRVPGARRGQGQEAGQGERRHDARCR